MPGCKQRISNAINAVTSHRRSLRVRRDVARLGSRKLKLALEVLLCDLDVLHGHVRALVTQQFHDGSEADARPQHLSSIRVAKLVRDNATPDPDCADDIA